MKNDLSDVAQWSSVSEAVEAFPTLVFSCWLRFRRSAADSIYPEWRSWTNDTYRVRFLDDAARNIATRN